ncbi:MAG: hypothetical protein CMJ34_10580 [Phycisphaerae bacterium]|nr:hypothetical protein [Phycisphaerae bacterium]
MEKVHDTGSGFLPDDYVKQRAERRTNIAAVVLFAVVMGGVALAYLATDRTWHGVRTAQASVNQRFDAAADRRAEMDAYVDRVERIVDKAHIAVGLLDAVPRSNLLAEIVDRMPDKLSMSRFNMSTTEIKSPRDKPRTVGSISTRGAVDGNVKGGEETEPRPEPRRWSTTVEIEGLAPSLAEISLFIDALVEMELFRRVRLDHTREVEISERAMREFRVLFELRPDADIRIVENPSVHANVIEEDPS